MPAFFYGITKSFTGKIYYSFRTMKNKKLAYILGVSKLLN